MEYHVLHLFSQARGETKREKVMEMTFKSFKEAVAALQAMSVAKGFESGFFQGEIWSYRDADSYGAMTATTETVFVPV